MAEPLAPVQKPQGPIAQANDWLIDNVRSSVPVDANLRASAGLTSDPDAPYTALFQGDVYLPLDDKQHLGIVGQARLEPGKLPIAFGGLNLFKYADVTFGVTDFSAPSTTALLRGQPDEVAIDADTIPQVGALVPELRLGGGYGRTLYSPNMVSGGFAYGFGRTWRGYLNFYMPPPGGARDNIYLAGNIAYDSFHPDGQLLSGDPERNVGHLDTEVTALVSLDPSHELLVAPVVGYESFVDQDLTTFDAYSLRAGFNLFSAPGTTKSHFERAFLQEYPIRLYAGIQHDWSGETTVVTPADPVEDKPADLSGAEPAVTEAVVSEEARNLTQINLHGEVNLLSSYQERSRDVFFARLALMGWIDAEIPLDGSAPEVSGGAKIEFRAKTKMSDRQ
jgi:hypothetical protein